MVKLLSYICACVFITALSFGQDSIITKSDWSVGLYGSYNFIKNSTSIPVFYGSTDCGVFSDGNTNGLNAGINVEYSLLPSLLSVSARVGYAQRPVYLTTDIARFEVFEPISRSYQPLQLRHTFDATLEYLVFDIGAVIQPMEEIPIRVRISADAGNSIFGNSYAQTEEIVSPQSVLFPTEQKIKTNFSGRIETITTSYGANGIISYDLEIGDGLYLSPEIGYRYGLNSIVTDAEWKQQSYFAGLSLRTRIGDTKYSPAPPPPPKVDTVVPPPPPPSPPVVVKEPAVRFSGVSSQPIIVEETIVTQTFPLLPYIFFDSAQAVLKSKISTTTPQSFSESDLPKDMLQTYYSILRIIGNRLKESPKTEITIIGNSDGIELASSTDRQKLAEKRAQIIADYLINNWKIDTKRINIETRDVPKIPTNIRYNEGYEENRRVEIYSDDPNILKPVVHSRFLEYAPVQDIQSFNTSLRSDIKPVSWKLSIVGKNGEITSQSGTNSPQNISLKIPQKSMSTIDKELYEGDSLKAFLKLTLDDGSELFSGCSVPVSKTKNVFEVSRLSLIVFDFNRYDITDQNKRMMQQFVRDAIKPTSITSITGTTDKLGEEQYNLELSKSRAFSVRDYLLSLQPSAKLSEVKGIGASVLPFDNSLPEGRYYCRTVSIEVKTPVK